MRSLVMWSAWVGLSEMALSLGGAPLQAGINQPPPIKQHAGADAARYDSAADYSAQFGGRAVLIMHGGKVVFERYDRGWTDRRPHPLASGTKSFTGVMAMLAVQDGLLTLDEPACDTLTEWKADPLKSRITVRHLLTLSSGLAPADAVFAGGSGAGVLGDMARRRAERLGGDERRGRPESNFEAAVAVEMAGEPGAQFRYGPSHFYAFGELLQRKLRAAGGPQTTVMDYLRARVLGPIGIDAARIGRDRAGNPNLPGGMALTAREWAKFGQFVLDQGSVRQPDGSLKNLLKPDLLAECFRPSANQPTYGLTWWLPGAAGDADEADAGAGVRGQAARQAAQNRGVRGPDGRPITVYMAAGLGKQRLYVLPQFDLVVVRFAEATAEGQRFDDTEFMARILGVRE